MEIQLADQRIFVLEDRLSFEEIRQRAMDRRTGAFGSGLSSLLQRPKADDIELIDSQRRVEPFWHVACQAHYVYDRARDYNVPVSGPEVREVSIGDQTLPVGTPGGKTGRTFTVSTVEHCREEIQDERFVDGLTAAPVADAASLINGSKQEVADPPRWLPTRRSSCRRSTAPPTSSGSCSPTCSSRSRPTRSARKR